MFRLPVCPHCGTIYRYPDTVKAIRKKENECYHCKKRFKAKMFPYMLIEAVVLIAVCIGINVATLSRMKRFEPIWLFIITLIFLLLIYLLTPFFVRFQKVGEENKAEKGKAAKKAKPSQKQTKKPIAKQSVGKKTNVKKTSKDSKRRS